MPLEDKPFVKFYKQHQKGVHAIEGLLIVLLLVGLNVLAFQNSKLNQEISVNCGWGEEDYECFCEKSDAIALKNKMEDEFDFEGVGITSEAIYNVSVGE